MESIKMAGADSNPYSPPKPVESTAEPQTKQSVLPLLGVGLSLMIGYALSGLMLFTYIERYFAQQSQLPPRLQDDSAYLGFAGGTLIGMSVAMFILVLVALIFATRNQKRGVAWVLIGLSVAIYFTSAISLNPFR